MPKKEEYGASSIKVLEGLEPVRKRPGMYIGSTSATGLHHLVWEVVDNSVDEALAGFCTKIKVTVHPDNSITVEDNGRGIPVAKHPQKKIPTLEVVLTVLHAGGKFDNNAYKVSGGLHGVGVSVVNALSKRLVVTVKRDGGIYQMEFARGKTVKKMEQIGTSKATGTTVTFWPDDEIFETTVYNYDTLHDRLQETAFLNKGLKIILTDERELTPRVDEFCYQGGIIDFVKFLNNEKEILPGCSKPIYIEGKTDPDTPLEKKGEVEVAMQWNAGYSENVMGFANDIYTEEGGMHIEGFRTALTKVMNDYARSHNLLKEKDANLTGDDIREGLCAIVSVKLPDPQFEGQTKAKLGSSYMRTLTNRIVSQGLSDYLEEHPNQAKEIFKKASQAARGRLAAQKARQATRRRGLLETASLPGKLADCSVREAAMTELFIVEGDSAGGSAKMARDRSIQAVLPLRGKILNVERVQEHRA
ncbi:MAG: ATP-binding protein, partial [Atopobiaceae bacterium]|nr:ATP-binding protein [Atopobiaceae bacterium]